jgi:hypothetical protein
MTVYRTRTLKIAPIQPVGWNALLGGSLGFAHSEAE